MEYNVERNPVIHIFDHVSLQTIGDPHLGREFRTNINLSRRGEKEESVWNSFENLLTPLDTKVKYIALVGDLFDTFAVKAEVVLKAFDYIVEAANKNTDIEYLIIPGNHDLSKDKTKASSYEILYRLLLLSDLPNVTIVYDEHYLFEDNDNNVSIFCTAYDPFENTELDDKFIKQLTKSKADNKIITLGHFDGFEINGKGYLPTPKMKELSDLIVSGHEHTYKEIKDPECNVLFTGSMQPYSHAEDPDSDMYITITPKLLEDLDTSVFKDMFVRILCEADYVLPERFDCISLTYKLDESKVVKTVEVEKEENEIDVDLDTLTYEQKLVLALELQEDLDTEYKELYSNKILTREFNKS
jgi:DNA repair exonuclease SbcCD nuclease subunit